MKTLKKFFTRDATLIAIQGWYDGITENCNKFFNVAFPENLFIYRNGTFECWRDAKRLTKELPIDLSKWAKANPNKISQAYNKLANSINYYQKLENKVNNKTSVNELLEYVQKTYHYIVNGFPGLLAALWFPVWQAEFMRKGKKLFNNHIIELSVKCREAEGDVFFSKSVDTTYFLLNRIAEYNGWDKEIIKFITIQELTKAIKNKKSLPLEIILKRQNTSFAYIQQKIFYEPNIKKELLTIGFQLKEDKISQMNEIKGQVGNKGSAKGIVSLIYNRGQLSKINKGDILVSPMTSPWCLPAIKKSAAIITDEGGVTCHAAITSRELNKPCIIGTKIATKILKNGDLVEVDANKGIIKVLKRY